MSARQLQRFVAGRSVRVEPMAAEADEMLTAAGEEGRTAGAIREGPQHGHRAGEVEPDGAQHTRGPRRPRRCQFVEHLVDADPNSEQLGVELALNTSEIFIHANPPQSTPTAVAA